MDTSNPPASAVGQTSLAVPTTFGGIAAVAAGPPWRLLAWQVFIALTAGALIVWALDITWGTILQRAVLALPEAAEIRDGRLIWPSTESTILEEDPFLVLVVDPRGKHDSGLASDLSVFVESDRVMFRSILGWAGWLYSPDLQVPLGRVAMASLFATWRIPALIGLGLVISLGLWLSWCALATGYAPLIWGAARVFSRPVSLLHAWRLAAACLLPPALLMTAVVVLYATRSLGVLGLLLAVPIHLALAWVFLLGALTRLRPPQPTPENPFVPEPAPEPEPLIEPKPKPPANPFQAT